MFSAVTSSGDGNDLVLLGSFGTTILGSISGTTLLSSGWMCYHKNYICLFLHVICLPPFLLLLLLASPLDDNCGEGPDYL